ncbi:MAG: hypothetical protein KME30_31325 [Iphinoe sp. HA4291-MV1]|jgi:hypothetical protein|nr:hypothetical protein [Iphinoe sp. HA4291-MV1]
MSNDFFDPAFWENAGINPVSIDLDNPQHFEDGIGEIFQRIADEIKNIREKSLAVKTFEVVMTATEYDHFDDLCSDLAGNHVVDFKGVIHSHLVPQVNPEDVPEGIDAVNFHIEVVDDFTEEVFLEFDTNLPDL